MKHHSDLYLLALLKDGDIKAFDRLFLKYYKLLCANAYSLLRDEQEAKDIVQLFFVEMWERKLFMGLEGDIKGYLYRSVQNRCLNQQRKQLMDQKRQEMFIQTLESFEMEDQWMEHEPVNLQDALLAMPGQRREALQLVYLQNKKYRDAADVMGISINSLKTHLKIGLRVLREKLNK
ncbi:sigma-70 family RNA polymerase sigma factor [Dyadobacter sp. CY323]|uniref:sigma-70 family RNA polymerase sigma factor n=1 Tax=Dyadobacter sp. CY323 TaxID=2907302 RepID=UPI001F383891|nr:sigma-70 family RNA polymerase sigma factor [Dyadobacter sp. CY323]MCE6992456.1 sigma-70 family RNA polymerase sigma factor [Dyadobacter sp. CY323]